MKKRYTLTDSKTGLTYKYSKLQWETAWWLMYVFGIILGIMIGQTL